MRYYFFNLLFILLLASNFGFAQKIRSRKNVNNVAVASTNPKLISSEAINVSIIQLIANPEKYHKKVIRAIGYVHLAFEGNAIFLHKDDFENAIPQNGLWLNVSSEIKKQSAKYNDKYVIVEGTFDANSKEHFGMLSGSIGNITRFEEWIGGKIVLKKP